MTVVPTAPAGFRGRPRPAATLIVVDREAGEPRLLMGRRRADAAFLPNTFVFPGGRLEASDADAATVGALPPAEAQQLQRGRRGRPELVRALAVAAVRETFEETGLAVAVGGRADAVPAGAAWSDLLAHGLTPDLSRLRFAARAITPPGRPRRFDTRFFLADAADIRGRFGPGDGELTEIGWYGLSELESLNLPSITRLVLGDLQALLSGSLTGGIPFYFWRGGGFRRVLLSQHPGPA